MGTTSPASPWDEIDDLGRLFDLRRCGGALEEPVLTAREMHETGTPGPRSGAEVAKSFSVLGHYTTELFFNEIKRTEQIGADGGGVYLTPTGYPGWVASHELGLPRPCTHCLLVEVEGISEIWGPGLAAPSTLFPEVWLGGGIEFYVSKPIPYRWVKEVVECGDGRSHHLLGPRPR